MIPPAIIDARCVDDGTTWEKLLQHHRQTQHHVVCQGGDDRDGMTWVPRSQEYLHRLKEHNVCTTCEEHLQSPINLENVSEPVSFMGKG